MDSFLSQLVHIPSDKYYITARIINITLFPQMINITLFARIL